MPEETREGTISEIRWERPGNAWKRLRMASGQIWTGKVGPVVPGTLLRARGHEVTNRYGTSFEVAETLTAVLNTAQGVAAWLAYRLPQIGEHRATALVERFGDRLLEVIEHSPADLAQVRGITQARASEIQKVYLERRSEQAVVSELVDHGLSLDLSMRAWEKYREGLPTLLAEDPYDLIAVDGITFAHLDPVAQHLGVDPHDPRRVRAYARFRLKEVLDKGDCYLPRIGLVGDISRWGIPGNQIVDMLCASRYLVVRNQEILLREIDAAEDTVARGVRRSLGREKAVLVEEPVLPDWLDAGQQQAVLGLLTDPICLLTGGPGTGKTTTLLAALDILEKQGHLIKCAAPTGKAAKRMTEVTGRQATTIHRLLEWHPNGWRRNATEPLLASVVVIDEASMVDIRLAAALFDALGQARLIIVGDSDQLPPVGPGQPLHDLLRSEKVPTYRLTIVHRQKGDSWVCDNAHRIIAGQNPDLTETADFEFGEFDESEQIIDAAIHVAREFPGLQILTPEHQEGAGTINLNRALQAALNPDSQNTWTPYLSASGYRIYAGDKVLYTRNDKDTGLVNGDIGYVAEVTSVGNEVAVMCKFDGVEGPEDGLFKLSGTPARYLTLAYAMTVHKCVAADTLVGTEHGLMTQKELVESSEKTIATANGLHVFRDAFLSKDKRPCIRITTEDGYELTVTPDHKMMAWTGNSYELVQVQQLHIHQFLRLAFDWPTGQLQELPPLPSSDVRAKRYKTPKYLSSEVAEFLGLMVADGTLYQRGFRLAKRHKDVVDRFCKLCHELFFKNPQQRYASGAHHAEINSVALSDWLRLIGGMDPNNKAIPVAVLRSDVATQGAFLRGLFEDGTVNIDKRTKVLDHIEWSSCYETITRQVQILLLRFGIISSRILRDGQWLLYIYGANAHRFAEKIGFINRMKNMRLRYNVGREQRYRIPVRRNDFNCKTFTGQNARGRGYISRATAAELGNFEDQLRFHHSRIAKLETTIDRVGCVTVPKYGRFLQNGFDGGNSQGSEWPFVLIVADKAHWTFRRQLLYTAVTRAHERVAIVGSRDAIERAVKKPRDTNRRTLLCERLQGEST